MSLGYCQISGLDFEDIHSPVMNEVGMRIMIIISIENKWKCSKLDVESAFLLGNLKIKYSLNYHKDLENVMENWKAELIPICFGVRGKCFL